MDANKKSFDLIVRAKETFDLYIYNFQMAVTFFFRIRDKIRLSFIASLITKMITTLSIKKVRLQFSMKLKESVSLILNSKRINISYIFKERLKALVTIVSGATMILNMKLRQKLSTTLHQGILTLSISPILAKFFLLSDFDLDILGDLDVNDLGDMDYIIK
jgi:hypothetical protein